MGSSRGQRWRGCEVLASPRHHVYRPDERGARREGARGGPGGLAIGEDDGVGERVVCVCVCVCVCVVYVSPAVLPCVTRRPGPIPHASVFRRTWCGLWPRMLTSAVVRCVARGWYVAPGRPSTRSCVVGHGVVCDPRVVRRPGSTSCVCRRPWCGMWPAGGRSPVGRPPTRVCVITRGAVYGLWEVGRPRPISDVYVCRAVCGPRVICRPWSTSDGMCGVLNGALCGPRVISRPGPISDAYVCRRPRCGIWPICGRSADGRPLPRTCAVACVTVCGPRVVVVHGSTADTHESRGLCGRVCPAGGGRPWADLRHACASRPVGDV